MELVYLWVEDYKNIYHQGFSFSPRFECKYENNELTIIEKKKNEYIKDFFAKNINVTAIVGKNGSGKSNILESLIHLSLENSYNKQEKLIFTLYFFNGKYYIFSTHDKTLKINSNMTLLKNNETFLMYYDYSMSTIVLDYDEIDKDIVDNSYFDEIKEEQNHPLIMQPVKSTYSISIIENIDKKAMDYMLKFNINNSIEFIHIKNFFQPKYFKLSFDYRRISGDESNYDNDNPIYKKIENFYRPDNFVSEYNRDELIDLTIFYMLQTIFNKSRESDSLNMTKEFEGLWYQEDDIATSFDKHNIDGLMVYIKNHDYKDLFLNEELEIEENFKFIDFLKKQDKTFFIDNKLYEIEENKNLLKNLATWINIELLDSNEISFYDLSYGEKFLIKFIYNLLYQIDTLNQLHKYENITLLLDEVEQGLHPEWQKNFLDLLISILETQKSFYFNIVCATHSPFILSDLPKKNIFFMKNGKQSKGVEHDQTFGANIHTLLSDSFFMENGLMGEFAKNKIRTIKVAHRYILHKHEKKFLTKESYDKSKRLIIEKLPKFWQIQSIIGEPFLQKIVKNQLEEIELILLGRDEAIDKEIARLQALKASSKNA